MATPRRIGVILAAGRGGRMGSTKQLIAWRTTDGEKPLVAAAFDAIRPICDEMVVVLGHDADAVAAALGDRPFQRADSDAAAPMFESIRAGLCAAHRIASDPVVVVQPGDHPEVAPATLSALVSWSLKRPLRTILPQYAERGGHPVFIPPEITAILREAVCPQGLGQFWLDHPELCHRVPVNDPAVVRDIDTPSDLG